MSNIDNLFERATRLNITFTVPGHGGKFAIHDLWTLPLQSANGRNLDEIAKALRSKCNAEESFITPTVADEETTLAFEIVKRIITVRQAEAKAAGDAKKIAERRRVILEAIETQQTKELGSKSLEDLQKMLEELK